MLCYTSSRIIGFLNRIQNHFLLHYPSHHYLYLPYLHPPVPLQAAVSKLWHPGSAVTVVGISGPDRRRHRSLPIAPRRRGCSACSPSAAGGVLYAVSGSPGCGTSAVISAQHIRGSRTCMTAESSRSSAAAWPATARLEVSVIWISYFASYFFVPRGNVRVYTWQWWQWLPWIPDKIVRIE